MASTVAEPLETQFSQINGLTEMTSMNVPGTSTVTLQFDLDRNIDAASTDVLEAINAAQGQLPKNLPNQPTIRKVNRGRRSSSGRAVGRVAAHAVDYAENTSRSNCRRSPVCRSWSAASSRRSACRSTPPNWHPWV
jgi:Cu/Ag efflux pump CusA